MQEQEQDIGSADVNSALTATAAPMATSAAASPVAAKAVAAAPAEIMPPDSPVMASPAPARAPSASKSRLNLFSNHLYIALEQDGDADASANDQDDRDQGRGTQLQERQSNGGTASALSSLLTSSASLGGAAAATPAALQPPASALLLSVGSLSSSVMPHLGLDLFRGDSNPLSGMGGDTGRDSSEEEGEAEPLRMPMRSFLDAIASCTTPLQPTSSGGSVSAAAADRPAGYPMAAIASFVGAASGASQPAAIRCCDADTSGSQATTGPSGTSIVEGSEEDVPCSPVVPLKTESEAARVLTASALKRAFSTPAQQQQGQRLGQQQQGQGQRLGPEHCSLLPQLSESALSAAPSGETARSCLAPSSGIPTLLTARSPSCSVPNTPSAPAAATSTPKSGARRGKAAAVTPGSSCQEGVALGDRKENMEVGLQQHAGAGAGSAQGKRSATKVVTPLGPSSNHNTPGSGTKGGPGADKVERGTGGKGGQSAERVALSSGVRAGTVRSRETVAGKAAGGAGGQKAAVPRRQQLYGWMVS